MRYLLHIIILLQCTAAWGQQGLPLTRQAAHECNSGQVDQALLTIEKALVNGEDTHPFAWYVKGYIHKQLFVDQDKKAVDSPNRELAISAIHTSLDLDSSGEHLENNQNALRFLSITYYNDAIRLTKSFTAGGDSLPEHYFALFQAEMLVVDTDYTFDQNSTDFYKHMARGFSRLFAQSGSEDKALCARSSEYYKQALLLSPNDYKANYNLAINYYNLGVARIQTISHNTDIFELLTLQDECVGLFKAAMPYMEKAHAQNPERVETLKGLMAIHRALSNHEASEKFRQELHKVLGTE